MFVCVCVCNGGRVGGGLDLLGSMDEGGFGNESQINVERLNG